MADDNARELCALGDKLFTKKAPLDELHQTLAEQIYPERADFTVERLDGDEYATELYESGPPQARRELAGAIGAILRPRAKEWFKPAPEDDWRKTNRALAWCDFARDKMRRLLYNEAACFQKTMADADDDFVSFGNAIPILTENDDRNGFFLELTHLKENAWQTNRYNQVDNNHRKFKWTLRKIVQKYGEGVLSENQKTILKKNPFHETEIRHVLMPIEDYDGYKITRRKMGGRPYASVYINYEAQTILREGGYWEFPMLHRRWRVPTNSVYGYSPAAMLGLVDARLLQSQSRVILDAGELAVAPPILAKRDAVLGGVNNYAGATTWIDTDYDERFGDAVRTMDNNGDVRIGLEMKVDTRNILQAAFFLNKLTLPSDKDMTAYEASERIAEYIRSAGPVFEPFEADNARTLRTLFNMMLRIGYFGPIEEMPPELRGGEIQFEFDTPVSQAYQRVKVMRAQEVMQTFTSAVQVEPAVRHDLNVRKMFRETVNNIGADQGWLYSEDEAQAAIDAEQKQVAEAQQMQKADAMLGAADKAGGAAKKFSDGAANMPALIQQLQQLSGQQGGQQQPVDDGFPTTGLPDGAEAEDSAMAGGIGSNLDVSELADLAGAL